MAGQSPRFRTHCAALLASVVAGVAGAPTTTHAGNITPYAQSDGAAMTGGAVVAMTRSTGAVWYNPAGLAKTVRSRLDLSTSAFSLRARDYPNAMQTVLPDGTERGTSLDSLDLSIVPTALSGVVAIEPSLAWGFGVFVNESDSFSLQGGPHVTVDGGTTLQARGRIDESVTTTNVGAAIGWQVVPGLRLGVSLFGSARATSERGEMTVEATIAGDRYTAFADLRDARTQFGLHGVVGLQWQPTDALHIGVVLRLPTLALVEVGTAEVFTGGPAAPVGDDPVRVDLGDRDAALSDPALTVPGRVVLGVSYSYGQGWISVEGDVSHPLDDANLAGVWNARVGGVYRASRDVTLGAGLFTDRSRTRLNRFPAEDVDFYGATFGIAFNRRIDLAEHEEVGSMVISTSVALRYAYGSGEATGVRFDLGELVSAGRVGIGVGQPVSVTVHELAVQLSTGLYF